MWLPIKGYEGMYEVSDRGEVRSLARPVTTCYGSTRFKAASILKTDKSGKYERVQLGKDSPNYSVHRLVAQAFVPNPMNAEQVNHIDGNRRNNASANLEWCTCAENIRHSFKMGMSKPIRGSDNKLSKGVQCISADGDIVHEYASIREAALGIGVSRQSIEDTLYRKRRTCRGFVLRRPEAITIID